MIGRNTTMQLLDVCTLHSGYSARSRLEAATAGGVLAIQLRDVSPEGALAPDRLWRVQLKGVAERHLVRAGDVLFRSRGEHNTAIALDERLQEPALAVLPLLVLRPQRDLVLPEYLAWAINQPPAQRHFDASARGTKMRMVPRSSVEDLELPIPDLATQRRIVNLDALAEREAELSRHAADARRKMMTLTLLQRATSTHRRTSNKRPPV